MTTQEQSVPKYFADFVQENARQHQELADRISSVESGLATRISGGETSLADRISGVEISLGNRINEVEAALTARISGVETSLGSRISSVEGELRVIKAVSVAIFAAVAVAVIKYVFGL